MLSGVRLLSLIWPFARIVGPVNVKHSEVRFEVLQQRFQQRYWRGLRIRRLPEGNLIDSLSGKQRIQSIDGQQRTTHFTH
jgi:hypothetical protein